MSFSREVGAMVLAAVCIFCAGCDRKATISEAEGNSSVSPVENVSVQETLETGYITSSEITDNDYDSVESVDTKQSEIQNDTLLDRSVSFDKDKTRDEEYINRPMFLGQPEGSTYDIAESGEVKIVSGMVMGFAVVGDKISTDIGLHICASESNIPVDTITLSMDIGFDNGEISWSEPEFMLGWE